MNNKACLSPEGGLLCRCLQVHYGLPTAGRRGGHSGGFGLLRSIVLFTFPPDPDDAEFMKQGNNGVA